MGRMESDDYVNWNGLRTVMTTDLDDPLGTEFDNMTTDHANRTYAGLHIGMLWTFYMDINEALHSDSKKFWGQRTGAHRLDAFLETQLAFSRDTIKWIRLREPFIPRGKPGDWDWGCVYGEYPLFHKDKLYFYYVTSSFTHGGRTSEIWKSPLEDKERKHAFLRGFGLATMRLDGFVSVEPSGYGDGVLTTNRFRWEKDTSVSVNVDASHGELRVELLEDAGKVISGFTADDCDAIHEDVLDKKVTWKGTDAFPAPDYSRVPELGVHDWYAKLRFHLRRGTKLYSFRIDPPEVLEWRGWETEAI